MYTFEEVEVTYLCFFKRKCYRILNSEGVVVSKSYNPSDRGLYKLTVKVLNDPWD